MPTKRKCPAPRKVFISSQIDTQKNKQITTREFLINLINLIFDNITYLKTFGFNTAANKRFTLFYLLCVFIVLILYFVYIYSAEYNMFSTKFWCFTGICAVSLIMLFYGIIYTIYIDIICYSSHKGFLKTIPKKIPPKCRNSLYLYLYKQREYHTPKNAWLDTSSIHEKESRNAVFILLINIILLILSFLCYLWITNLIPICITQIGIWILSTIILIFTPICIKAIIKPIVNRLHFLPKDFVNFINQKFTFFGLRCTIFSQIWLKQRFIFLCLISLAWFVVHTLNTIYHMQFETLILSYCFGFSVCYTAGYSIITKNRDLGFIFCMFIYTFFIIYFSKFVFFSVLSLCCIDIHDMYNKTEPKPEGKTLNSDKVSCESNKNTTVIDSISKEKKSNKILSLLGLDYNKPRTWDIPDWARGYAKGPILRFISFTDVVEPVSTRKVEEELFIIERNGDVTQVTKKWFISSDVGLHLENSKKVPSVILSFMREKFFMKKPIQHITELSFEHKHKYINYTNVYSKNQGILTKNIIKLDKTGYETMLTKSKIENQTKLADNMTKINHINIYEEDFRYRKLGSFKNDRAFSAPVPLFRTMFYRLDHVVEDILDISCQLNKEIFPRLAALRDREGLGVQQIPFVLNRAFDLYARYFWNMNYLYTYHADIYKDMASFTVPKFILPSGWDGSIESFLWEIIEHIDVVYTTTIHDNFFMFFFQDASHIMPKDLGLTSYTFARKGIHYYHTMQGITIERNVLLVNTCIRDVNMGWFDGHWSEKKLSKALGFHFNKLTGKEEDIYHNYTPNNIMGVSYERLLQLLNKVKLFRSKERMKLIRFHEEFI